MTQRRLMELLAVFEERGEVRIHVGCYCATLEEVVDDGDRGNVALVCGPLDDGHMHDTD